MTVLFDWAAQRIDALTFAWLATLFAIALWIATTLGWQAIARRRALRRFRQSPMRSVARAWFVRDLLRRHAERFWERHR